MAIGNIMVIGAGQMGGGIAQVMAQAGHKVYLNDIKQEFIDNRIQFIEKLLTKNVAKGRMTEEEKAKTLENIVPELDMKKGAADSDLVIEAAIEDLKIKGGIFKDLDEAAKEGTILASNTSSLPITKIAAMTKRPDKVIGMHFMNPVPVMKLVEIIRGISTSQETFDTIKGLTEEIGKLPVEIKDFPAFALNRILITMINEAFYTLYEGVGSAEDIDTVMKYGANHPMGPLELADFIGLDTVLAIMTVMYEGFGDSKYRPCPLLKQYVQAGWVGKKCGRGVYTYDK
ncbi:MAG: 3-hydroxybutyryl-CoA dehydrogenase [Peptoniphilaceae bacterium]|nr:3-hydroxybutyryl-CoA dehydrogenase [Peptoniphilaceae bacterium]MDY6085802.1 3-hydroxybutyryl-CoA dehydrogenase [Peptoniphilaceae bacterium]